MSRLWQIRRAIRARATSRLAASISFQCVGFKDFPPKLFFVLGSPRQFADREYITFARDLRRRFFVRACTGAIYRQSCVRACVRVRARELCVNNGFVSGRDKRGMAAILMREAGRNSVQKQRPLFPGSAAPVT